jgi:hypothetical protein
MKDRKAGDLSPDPCVSRVVARILLRIPLRSAKRWLGARDRPRGCRRSRRRCRGRARRACLRQSQCLRETKYTQPVGQQECLYKPAKLYRTIRTAPKTMHPMAVKCPALMFSRFAQLASPDITSSPFPKTRTQGRDPSVVLASARACIEGALQIPVGNPKG